MQPGLWRRKRLTEGARSVSEPTSGGTELSERRRVPVGTWGPGNAFFEAAFTAADLTPG